MTTPKSSLIDRIAMFVAAACGLQRNYRAIAHERDHPQQNQP
jgi:hypothetical protein